jgi:JmjC domain
MPQLSLAAFLHPILVNEFLQKIFTCRPLHIEGERGRFGYLLPWDSLNSLMQSRQLEPPRIFLFKEGNASTENYTKPSSLLKIGSTLAGTACIDLAAFCKLLQQGYMLVINDIDEMRQPIRELCRMLEYELGDQVTANMYGGWHATQGFKTHWDSQDVIIVQLSGKKHWRIFEPERKHPVLQDYALGLKAPAQPPYWEGDLDSGDLLYIPRGWWHDAIPVGNEVTLHITLTMVRRTGLDLGSKLLDLLRDHECARADLPRIGTPDEKKAFLADFRETVMASLDKLDLDSYLRETDALAPARVRPSFPWIAAPELGGMESQTWVHWLPPRKVIFEEKDGKVFLAAISSNFEFDPSAKSLLVALAEKRRIQLSALCQIDSQMSIEATRRLILDLLSKGLVAIADNEDI